LSPDDCIFCRIASGDVPSDVVLSTDEVVAFRDINPQAPVHVQVIPRRHVTDASEIVADDGPLLAQLFAIANRVAAAEGISGRGYRLLFNVGEDANNSVPHLHLHVLGGRRLGWPPG
jgi:histidine triad (HIT) family protein